MMPTFSFPKFEKNAEDPCLEALLFHHAFRARGEVTLNEN